MFHIGADPEVFITNKQGLFISAIDKVGGSKQRPRQLTSMPDGFTVQEDNVAVEFGIPPCATEEQFVNAIVNVQEAVKKELPQFTFSNLSCTVFPEEEMIDPRAYVFGCEPDYSAWTGKKNKVGRSGHPYLRSAGGHVHVQLDNLDLDQTAMKYMDLCLAIPSMFMDKNGEERRKLYGKAGAYRPKPYGAEYRTLSNFWIFDKNLISWVFRNTKEAVKLAEEDILDIDSLHDDIVDSINNNNLRRADKLVNMFALEVL